MFAKNVNINAIYSQSNAIFDLQIFIPQPQQKNFKQMKFNSRFEASLY
jgi:hypothetical protein